MRSFFAFVIGLFSLLLIYYFVSIPIIPCISIILTAFLFLPQDRHMIARMTFIIIITAIAVILYFTNAILMVAFYPMFGNVLAIIFEFISVALFLFLGIPFSIGAFKTHEDLKSQKTSNNMHTYKNDRLGYSISFPNTKNLYYYTPTKSVEKKYYLPSSEYTARANTDYFEYTCAFHKSKYGISAINIAVSKNLHIGLSDFIENGKDPERSRHFYYLFKHNHRDIMGSTTLYRDVTEYKNFFSSVTNSNPNCDVDNGIFINTFKDLNDALAERDTFLKNNTLTEMETIIAKNYAKGDDSPRGGNREKVIKEYANALNKINIANTSPEIRNYPDNNLVYSIITSKRGKREKGRIIHYWFSVGEQFVSISFDTYCDETTECFQKIIDSIYFYRRSEELPRNNFKPISNDPEPLFSSKY